MLHVHYLRQFCAIVMQLSFPVLNCVCIFPATMLINKSNIFQPLKTILVFKSCNRLALHMPETSIESQHNKLHSQKPHLTSSLSRTNSHMDLDIYFYVCVTYCSEPVYCQHPEISVSAINMVFSVYDGITASTARANFWTFRGQALGILTYLQNDLK